MIKNSEKFVFVLGREKEIALAELKSVFLRLKIPADIYNVTANLIFANIDNFSENDTAKLIDILAGTIKIFKIVGRHPDDIKKIIADQKSGVNSKFNFGISDYSGKYLPKQINDIGIKIKISLKKEFKTRFVALKNSSELSSIVSLKNKLAESGIEIGVFENGVGVLVDLNNPEEWNRRDYGKPASDKFSGMVPPKLARMMINLALEFNFGDTIVVDPFCGSGNILLEALMLGFGVVGSDISEKAVGDSKKNINWLADQYQLSNRGSCLSASRHQIFQADATDSSFIEKIKPEIKNYQNLVFVSEPFLGEPKKFMPSFNAAKGEYLKIKDLYLDFLKNIKNIVGGKKAILCLVFPLVETTENKRFSLLDETVDEIKNLGYTQIRPSLIYGRDYQVVKREIVLFKLV